jgi:eukaryotic-like serine/threonine-protein kinase
VNADEDYYQPPPKSPIPAAVIASIITAVVVFFGLRALDQRGTFSSGAKQPAASVAVDMPSLLGLRPEQARELLQGREILLAFSVERDSAQYPAGTIAEQTPLAGSQVARGSAVQAVLSRGLKLVAVPKLVGLKSDEAVRQLAAVGLSSGPGKEIASDTVPAGITVQTEPPAGASLVAQGVVTLVVSSGVVSKPIPKVTGMRLRAGRELLEQQGFKVGKIRYDSDGDRSSGVVLDQKPAPPATAPAGTPVDLTVNED